MEILMALAGAGIGFQIPDMVGALSKKHMQVPLGATIVMAFSCAVVFYWMAS